MAKASRVRCDQRGKSVPTLWPAHGTCSGAGSGHPAPKGGCRGDVGPGNTALSPPRGCSCDSRSWRSVPPESWRALMRVSIFSSSPESPEGNTFDCLVFASGSEQECEEIIKRIGKGTFYFFRYNYSKMWSTKNCYSMPPHARSNNCFC